MLDLEVQSANQPGEDPTPSREINSGFDLMGGPSGLYAARVFSRHWKTRFLDTVR
jgi:hypothetical protein